MKYNGAYRKKYIIFIKRIYKPFICGFLNSREAFSRLILRSMRLKF